MKTINEMIKISIIMPCYNVAQYIERSVNSILSQNFEGHEIIIVNDGSTDNLLDVCRQWENLTNFIILSTKNQGVSQARNAGLAIARGEYVFFCDPDDYIYPDMLPFVFNAVYRWGADAIHFGYRTTHEDEGGFTYVSTEIPKVYVGNDVIRHEYMPMFLGITQDDIDTWISADHLWGHRKQFASVWRFLFKRKVLTDNQIKFYKDVKLSEDKLFVICFMCYAQSIVTINDVCYHYFIRKKGGMTSLLADGTNLATEKVNLVLCRGRIRQLYMDVHNEDIFNCYIGSLVFSCLELIVKLSDIPFMRSLSAYYRYRKLDDVERGIRTIKVSHLPMKLKIPILMLKCHCDLLIMTGVRTAKMIGIKVRL